VALGGPARYARGVTAPALHLGRHLIVELNGCMPAAIASLQAVEDGMVEAATAAGATLLGRQFHEFAGGGVSGMIVIAESHLSIHTWPEHGYAAVDIFTCGPRLTPEAAIAVLTRRFGASPPEILEISRGARSLRAAPLAAAGR
jgi:S-adenosylmethionine decarboxylase proenzyme